MCSWGSNAMGQCGHGKGKMFDVPTKVEGLNRVAVVEVGAGSFHSLVRDQKGDIYSSGSNLYGQLGQNNKADLDGFKASSSC